MIEPVSGEVLPRQQCGPGAAGAKVVVVIWGEAWGDTLEGAGELGWPLLLCLHHRPVGPRKVPFPGRWGSVLTAESPAPRAGPGAQTVLLLIGSSALLAFSCHSFQRGEVYLR